MATGTTHTDSRHSDSTHSDSTHCKQRVGHGQTLPLFADESVNVRAQNVCAQNVRIRRDSSTSSNDNAWQNSERHMQAARRIARQLARGGPVRRQRQNPAAVDSPRAAAKPDSHALGLSVCRHLLQALEADAATAVRITRLPGGAPDNHTAH